MPDKTPAKSLSLGAAVEAGSQQADAELSSLQIDSIQWDKFTPSPRTARDFVATLWKANDQPFHFGSFVINDPDLHMYDLLVRCPETYTRMSSHVLPGCDSQYGIDFEESVYLEISGTGEKMRTVLIAPCQFGENGGQALFLKPENHGMGSCAGTVAHGCSYVRTRPCWRPLMKCEGSEVTCTLLHCAG